MPRLRPSDLARELGVTRQAIHELKKRGLLPIAEDGTYDLDEVRASLAENLMRTDAKTLERVDVEAPRPAAPPPDAASTPDAEEETAITSFHVARTLNEATKAKIAALELRRMQGELAEVSVFRRTAETHMRLLRDTLMGMPAHLAPRLASETDAAAVEDMLSAAIRDALTDAARVTRSMLTEPGA